MIPRSPGVYIFKDKWGQVLYVGKALDLKRRVSAYFKKNSDFKTARLAEKIVDVETIQVSSEIEALILEANLIKKYKPAFNIKLTDDKDFLYIKITKEQFPKIITARKKDLPGAKKFFGPFPSAKVVRDTLKRLRRIFPWCTGNRRPCFYYHLNLCPGVCWGKISQKEYAKIIRRFIKFMEGKKEELSRDLTKEMQAYAKNQEFEKAGEIKKVISGMEYLLSSTSVKGYLEDPNFLKQQNKLALACLQKDLGLTKTPERIEGYDISNIQGKDATGSMVVLTGGEIDKSQYRKFRILISGRPNDVAMMREMIERRFRHCEWPKPDLIIVDGGRAQARAVKTDIPVFGLAKRLEWIYPPEGRIIKLSRKSLSLKLLQKLRDEAHRFAIRYHRKLRGKMFL